jgi:hypothetical protein
MLPTVPKRSNVFQVVVSVIYDHLAAGASIEESAMLTNSATGKKREVDVVLRSTTAGHEVVIGIEAAAHQRDPMSVEWVERMAGKHKYLPTDKVVLVSESGFSPQAEALAKAERLITISPETIEGGDPAVGILGAIRSLWPRRVVIAPSSARLHVEHSPNQLEWITDPPAELNIFTADGTFLGYFANILAIYAQSPAIRQKIEADTDLQDTGDDMVVHLKVGSGPAWSVDSGGAKHSFYVRNDEGLCRVDEIEITLEIQIIVGEQVPLHHRQLTDIDVTYAFGEGSLCDAPAIFVATDTSEGLKLSVRPHPRPKS